MYISLESWTKESHNNPINKGRETAVPFRFAAVSRLFMLNIGACIMKTGILLILFSMFLTQNLIAEECIYTEKQSPDNPHPERSLQGECGKLIGDDYFQIYPNHLDKLLFSDGKWGAINKKG